MRIIVLLIVICFNFFSGWSQQFYKPDVSPFTKIEVYGSFDIELVRADKESVKMESASVDLSKVGVNVKKGVLKIKSIQKIFEQEKQVRIIIGYKNLNSILLSNGAALYSEAKVNLGKLRIIQGNGSKIEMKLNVSSLQADIDKAATLNLSGTCGMADVEVSTGAIFNAYDLVCDSAVVRANAKGLIKINVAKYLDARASTGGEVSYRGIPKFFKQKTIMGGTIEKVMEYNSSPSQ